MSQALTRYHALHAFTRSRRVKPEFRTGLDAIYGRGTMKVRSAGARGSWLMSEAKLIDTLAAEHRNMSDAALDDTVATIRERFVRGKQDREAVRRAMACTREVARRATGEEAYVVQLMGAMGLYHGRIIEMVTGEGKTLTGSIAAPLIAWQHRHLHVFTVNDYLAKRDAEGRTDIYNRCGCSVGAIQQEDDPQARAEIYTRDIVYGTPKQITADWLRDQIRMGPMHTAWAGRQHLRRMGGPNASGMGPIVPGLQAAMVDEADAVLIDEGVVPLIIARSRREDEMAQIYRDAARIAAKLDEGPDYKVDHLRRKADLKHRGEHRAEQMYAQLEEPIWRAARRADELVRQALVAKHCYKHGQQYQIVEGQIVIVDEYTGRFLPDRSWEHGLHQAVEAKEGLDVTADRETLARLSFQRFFRSYPFMAGMTGTAADAKGEMETVYSRPVTVIPTNRPIARVAMPMRLFRTAETKWNAIVESIEEIHRTGRPVLVGTRSIAASEYIAERLTARGLPHRVLNANFDKDEADVIASAGHAGHITVATNMAGRGTDIRLDPRAREAGGLHVLLTELHAAQRIDRQFIGRAGRQGDPGSSQLFASLEDELPQQHARHLAGQLARRASSDEMAATSPARGLFRLAQRRAEARDRRNRASVLRQDDWIDKHLPGG